MLVENFNLVSNKVRYIFKVKFTHRSLIAMPQADITRFIVVIVAIIAIFVSYWLTKRIIEWIKQQLKDVKYKAELDILLRAFVVLIPLLVFLYILELFGLPIGAFILAISIMIAIISFVFLVPFFLDAAAYIKLTRERSFLEGDTIELVNEKIFGRVTEVGLLGVEILKIPENSIAFIPHNKISRDVIINHSRPTGRTGVEVSVNISLEIAPEKLEKAKKAMVDAVLQTEGTVKKGDNAPAVYVRSLENVIKLTLELYVNEPIDIPNIKSQVIEKIYSEFHRAGIKLV